MEKKSMSCISALCIVVCGLLLSGCCTSSTITASTINRPVLLGKVITIKGNPENNPVTEKENFSVLYRSDLPTGLDVLNTELPAKIHDASEVIVIDELFLRSNGGNMFLWIDMSMSVAEVKIRIVSDKEFLKKTDETDNKKVPEKGK